MKLVVLGANGRTGSQVVSQALEAGAEVIAAVRSEDKRPALKHERLHVAVGDPCDPEFLIAAFDRQDAVISTLGGKNPSRRANTVFYHSASAIVEAAAYTGLNKVLVTSTALLFPPQSLLDHLLVMMAANVVRSARRMEANLSEGRFDLAIARCGWLNDDDEHAYRALENGLPDKGTSISRMALARFLVDTVMGDMPGQHVYGVSGPGE